MKNKGQSWKIFYFILKLGSEDPIVYLQWIQESFIKLKKYFMNYSNKLIYKVTRLFSAEACSTTMVPKLRFIFLYIIHAL